MRPIARLGAGCDPRATCTNDEKYGGVHCHCNSPLSFKERDGSVCQLGEQSLTVVEAANQIVVTVRKPETSNHTISVQARSEQPLNVSLSSTADFLQIMHKESEFPSVMSLYDMSRCARMHTCTHACTESMHARTHARMHARVHAQR